MTATIGDAVEGRVTLDAGRAQAPDRPPLRGDESTRVDVAEALARDAVTRKACLQVFSRPGEIDLSGELPTESTREAALAMAVPGVTRVNNGAMLPFVAAVAA